MKYNFFRASLALSGALLLCAGAHAQTLTSASVSNLKLQTFDMAPDDGIDARAQVNGSSTTLQTVTFFSGPGTVTTLSLNDIPHAQLEVNHSRLLGRIETYDPTYAPPLGAHYLTLNDYTHSLMPAQEVTLRATTSVDLTVTPNTMVAFSGVFRFAETISASAPEYWSEASASATVDTFLRGESSWSLQAHDALNHSFSIGYFNNTDEAMDLTFTFSTDLLLYATVPGSLQVSAVPEPSSWVMLAGGLAFLGALTRRRTAPSTIA